MKKKLFLVVLVIMLFKSWSQESVLKLPIEGVWKFKEVKAEEKNCNAPSPFPLQEIHLLNNSFILIGLKDTVKGSYERLENKLRFYEAVRNGKPQAKEEFLTIKSIQKEEIILELPFECGIWNMKFKKIK